MTNSVRSSLAVSVAFAGGIAACWLAGSLMVAGHARHVPAARAPASDLRIETADGISLAATYRPGRIPMSPAVLLLHGVGASRAATAANAQWLAGLGYATLTIDFRGHGESAPAERSFGLYESEDAAAAFAWLKRREDGAPVAVVGISMGGAASLLGANGPLPADALVLQAVYPDIRHAIRDRIAARLGAVPAMLGEPLLSYQSRLRFGIWPSALSPIRALPNYHGPVLVVGGAQDRYTPPAESRAMFDAVAGPRWIWMRPGGGHAEICNAQDPEYRGVVARFLAETIGVPVDDRPTSHADQDARSGGVDADRPDVPANKSDPEERKK